MTDPNPTLEQTEQTKRGRKSGSIDWNERIEIVFAKMDALVDSGDVSPAVVRVYVNQVKYYDQQLHWAHKARYDARQSSLKQRVKELEAENRSLKAPAPRPLTPVNVWSKADLQVLLNDKQVSQHKELFDAILMRLVVLEKENPCPDAN